MDRGYLASADEEPGTPGSGVGLGYHYTSPYTNLSCPQPRDPQALVLHSFRDEQEALEACQEEWDAMSRRRVKKSEKLAMASRLLSVGDRPGHDFFEQLAVRLDEYNVSVPTVQIEYRGLTVRTEAVVGSAGIPTAGNFAPKLIKAALGLNKGSTKELTVLDNLHGVLKPGRCTLLLGPPGSGKSTLLKVLGNRLRGCSRLEVSGDVLYNGHSKDEFVVERTTAYVDQHDNHIPNLTVAETVNFAHTCHSGFDSPTFNLPGELCKAKVERSVANMGAMRNQMQQLRTLLTPKAAAAAVRASAAAASAYRGGHGHAAAVDGCDSMRSSSAGWQGGLADFGFNVAQLDGVMALDEIEQLVAQVWSSTAKTEVVMQLLGLGHCRDTIVGDGGLMLRGISGGERKRLTTAEMVVGPQRVLLMDEISTGLDSATLHSVITFFTSMSHALKMTTVISLLQPPPEVFSLFDDLMLLCEGRMLYHGPLEGAVPHFTSSGFICPMRKDVASFLLEVTTPTGQMEYASKQLLCAVHMRGGPAHPGGLLVSLDEMTSRFWSESAAGASMLEALAQPFDRNKSHPAALEKQRFALSPMQAVSVVSRRQMKLVWRDKVLLRGRMLQVIIVSAMVGSLFWQLGHKVNDARNFCGASFMAILFMTMGSMPQIGVVTAQKAVWLKHRDSLLYPGYAHGVAMALSQLPVSVMEATLFSCIVYFMVGFHRHYSYFLTFWGVVASSNLCLSALFRFVAVLAPNPTLAAGYGGIALLLLILTSGFSIVRKSIPVYWIWAYYTSPFAYALRALVINEFTGPDWKTRVWGVPGAKTLGEAALLSFDFYTDRVWICYGVIFLLGAYLLLSALTCIALDFVSGPQKVARLPDPEQLKEVRAAAEHRRSMAALQLRRAADRAARRKTGASSIGGASIMSSIAASLSGYRRHTQANSREVSVRGAGGSRTQSAAGGGNNSNSINNTAGQQPQGMHTSAAAARSISGSVASTTGLMTVAGSVTVGSAVAPYVSLTSSSLSAAAAAAAAAGEGAGKRGGGGGAGGRAGGAANGNKNHRDNNNEGRVSESVLSDSCSCSDTSSNFEEDYLPGALGVAFIPITLVFRDLRYFVPNPSYVASGCCGWLFPQGVAPPLQDSGDAFSPHGVQLSGACPSSPRKSSGTNINKDGGGGTPTSQKIPWQHLHYSSSVPRRRTTSLSSSGRQQQQQMQQQPTTNYTFSQEWSGSSHAAAAAVQGMGQHHFADYIAAGAPSPASASGAGADGYYRRNSAGDCYSREHSGSGGSSSSSSSCLHVSIQIAGSGGGAAAASAASAAVHLSGAAEVPKELELLKGVSGFAVPGKLMALMGGSGAGKTTLMDCICGRKTVGRITGQLLANGRPVEKSSWSRVVGYVEQMDVHTAAQTVREALWFSGRLRLGTEVSDEQVRAYVEQVIDMVDLTDQSFSLVGLPGATGGGLSTEQLKRLTIAVELVANPSVVFLDEPTSGLDARAAAIVMSAVRNVASSGRTVMVTIHQPSIEIFEAFDTLLLLQRGGRTTYFGPLGTESSQLVAYLQAVPGTAPLTPGTNPATWMLEVTGGSMAIAAACNDVDWPAIYAGSSLAAHNAAQADALQAQGLRCGVELDMSSMYAQPPLVQLRELLRKYCMVYWRTPSYTLARCFLTLAVALVYGSMYYGQGRLPKPYASMGNIQNIMGIMFSSTSFLGMTNLMAVMPLVGMERVVFYRERGALPYDPFAYGFAIALVEVPYLILQVLLFVPIIYIMIGFQLVWDKALYYAAMFLASISFYTIFGQFMVYVTPSQQTAQVVSASINFTFNLWNGFVITYPSMPYYWQWLNRCVPTTWVLYGLGVSQLGDVTQLVSFAGRRMSVKTFVQGLFDYHYDMRWPCLAIMVAYVVFFRTASIMALRYLNFLRR